MTTRNAHRSADPYAEASSCSVPRISPLSSEVTALDLDASTVSYAQLADLDTATEKARRDAPAIAVCDIASSIT
jgi:hypothetical protein